MLSQCSLASSTGASARFPPSFPDAAGESRDAPTFSSSSASTYSCSTAVAGDDQSSISTSSSSQSDVSTGGRLPFWAEPSARLPLSTETASSSSTPKVPTGSDHRLPGAPAQGARPSSSQDQRRGLNHSGWQSSLDSGIGMAAGSQTSYSGSFSSYTGSLDTSSQDGSEEFGSVASLPWSSPPSAPPPSPPPSLQSPWNPEHRSSAPIRCPWDSRLSSSLSHRHSDEHQTASLLTLLGYDSPRRALQSPPVREPSKKHSPPELCRDSRSSQNGGETQGQKLSSRSQSSSSWGSDMAPPVDGEERCAPRLQLPPGDVAYEVGQT